MTLFILNGLTNDESSIEQHLRAAGHDRAINLEKMLLTKVATVRQLGILYEAQPDLPRSFHEKYCEGWLEGGLISGAGPPECAWLPRVTRDARVGFERATANELNDRFDSNFTIVELLSSTMGRRVPAANREVYYPILHAYPLTPLLILEDMGNQTEVFETITSASSCREAVISRPWYMRPPRGVAQNVLTIVSPAFINTTSVWSRHNQSITSYDEEDNASLLLGVGLSLVKTCEFMADTVQAFSNEYAEVYWTDITDGASEGDEYFICGLSLASDMVIIPKEDYDKRSNNREWVHTYTFSLGSREYRFQFYAGDAFGSSYVNSSLSLNLGMSVALNVGVMTLVQWNVIKERRLVEMRHTLEAEAQLHDARHAAVERFLQCTSHDMRTPVQAMSLVASMLPDVLRSNGLGGSGKPTSDNDTRVTTGSGGTNSNSNSSSSNPSSDLPGEVEELLSTLQSCSSMMDLILSNVLNLQKIASGKLELQRCPSPLVLRLREMVRVIQTSTSARHGVHLRCAVGAEVPRLLDCDAPMLLRVVMNLITNALKFTDRGRVLVEVQLVDRITVSSNEESNRTDSEIEGSGSPKRRTGGRLKGSGGGVVVQPVEEQERGARTRPGSDSVSEVDAVAVGSMSSTTSCSGSKVVNNVVRFSVTDTGRGMSAEEMSNCFEAYQHADTSQGGGSGLGLHICRTSVEIHGGTLHVESKVGHGTRFWFELVLASDRAEQQQKRSGDQKWDDDDHQGTEIRMRGDSRSEVFDLEVNGDDVVVCEGGDSVSRSPQRGPGSRSSAGSGGADAGPASSGSGSANCGDSGGIQKHGQGGDVTSGSSKSPSGLPKLRILFAEDNPVNVKLGTRMLERAGHTVVAVTDGHQLLAALCGPDTPVPASTPTTSDASGSINSASSNGTHAVPSKAGHVSGDDDTANSSSHTDSTGNGGERSVFVSGFDALLTDIEMPGMKGDDAVARYRAWESVNRHGTRLPVCALTGQVTAAEWEVFKGKGVDVVLSKPYSLKDVERFLTKFVV